MNFQFFDDVGCHALRPIASTRSLADVPLGLFSIKFKWHLSLTKRGFNGDVRINSRYLPTSELIDEVLRIPSNASLMDGNTVVAQKGDGNHKIAILCSALALKRLPDLFSLVETGIAIDVTLLQSDIAPIDCPYGAKVLGTGKHLIYMGADAKAEGAMFNLKDGPVILGPGAEVMEGAMVRGPFVLGAYSQVKMGAKIYGPTSIGAHCKVGGELSNVLMLDFSNKGHDGFLGNSVIGEWCNLGADTNCSNLKNNYGPVKQWNYASGHFENTGLQFCGLVMGDHGKAGINTMFNTGTVLGVGANVYGGSFPPTFVPDFSWGGAAGMTEFQFEKFLETARAMMKRRGLTLEEQAIARLQRLFEETRALRNAPN